MVDSITASLMDAIEELKKLKPSREISLAITKAQEALMWWAQHSREAAYQRKGNE